MISRENDSAEFKSTRDLLKNVRYNKNDNTETHAHTFPPKVGYAVHTICLNVLKKTKFVEEKKKN